MKSSYISVREKNMKLLLSAINTYPRLLLHYHGVICHGLVDRGVSVRRVSAQLMEQLMKRLANETAETATEDTVEGKEALLLSSLQLSLHCLLKEGDSAVRSALLNSIVTVLTESPRTASGFARLASVSRVVLTVLDTAEDTAVAELLRERLMQGSRRQVASLVQWLCAEHLGEDAALVVLRRPPDP